MDLVVWLFGQVMFPRLKVNFQSLSLGQCGQKVLKVLRKHSVYKLQLIMIVKYNESSRTASKWTMCFNCCVNQFFLTMICPWLIPGICLLLSHKTLLVETLYLHCTSLQYVSHSFALSCLLLHCSPEGHLRLLSQSLAVHEVLRKSHLCIKL